MALLLKKKNSESNTEYSNANSKYPTVDSRYLKANLGWLYYKHYYEDQLQPDILVNRNETILKRTFHKENRFDLPVNCKFDLKVDYPGLLFGSGYTHEAIFKDKDKEDAFKIGFFFDHVTGMPVIPGHSIKGVLRAAFPNHHHEKYADTKSEMIVEYLKGIDIKSCFDKYLEQHKISGVVYSETIFADLLGHIIFEGEEPYAYIKNKFVYKQISLYKRDIFHDAYISKSGKDNLFMGTDYITPHADPLKNPNPIKFLKILPKVEIQFQFDLKDDLIKKDLKETLFKKILLDFGIGAKTNVGYGQFSEIK
ncbi:type III-B CRISPR module RAMP protein Cmr6 [Bacteroidia bacterium]|nr:type III-B CRISPR module RAMP protein Cmr6 [Bacteroidia bacterium]GHV09095.1 type III-B CRISPR module RAMP protein Cmr6 [Bacteroidia bacterium]